MYAKIRVALKVCFNIDPRIFRNTFYISFILVEWISKRSKPVQGKLCTIHNMLIYWCPYLHDSNLYALMPFSQRIKGNTLTVLKTYMKEQQLPYAFRCGLLPWRDYTYSRPHRTIKKKRIWNRLSVALLKKRFYLFYNDYETSYTDYINHARWHRWHRSALRKPTCLTWWPHDHLTCRCRVLNPGRSALPLGQPHSLHVIFTPKQNNSGLHIFINF